VRIFEDLLAARERAWTAMQLVRKGIDPIAARRKERAGKLVEEAKLVTFADAFEGFFKDKSKEWKNAVHRAQWQSTMRDFVLPHIGKLSIAEIDTSLVLKCLRPIWETRTETAKRTRGRIELVLSWAKSHHYRNGENPARWRDHLEHILAKPSKIARVEHLAAMDYDAVPGFVAKLTELDTQGARAIRLLILTAVRLGELRHARWDEVDLDGGVWVIPAAKTKRDRKLRVPLSSQALALIKSLPREISSPLLLPGPLAPRRPMSDQSLRNLLHELAGPVTLHGFRSSFSSWTAARTNYPTAVREAALGHAEGHATGDDGKGHKKVASSYQRDDLFEKRARLMQAWADFVSSPAPASKVTELRRKAQP
jgi:integrase